MFLQIVCLIWTEEHGSERVKSRELGRVLLITKRDTLRDKLLAHVSPYTPIMLFSLPACFTAEWSMVEGVRYLLNTAFVAEYNITTHLQSHSF